jgi:drug/metabolite transporter, DME family
MRERPLLFGSLVVVAAATGFGLLGPLARFAYDAGFEPLAFVAWRAAFGFLIVLAVVTIRIQRGSRLVNPASLPRRDGLALLLAAVAGVGLNVAVFFAFDLTTIALVLLAFYTYPALVALVAVALGHEQLDGTRWSALLLALVGMTLVVAGSLDSSAVRIEPPGIVLGLVAAAWQTVFVTVSRGRFRMVPPEQAMLWVLLFTVVACAALALLSGGSLDVALRNPTALGIAAFTGVAAAGIPSVLFLVGLRRIGGTRAGILMLFEPVVGVTLAALLLDEALLPIQVAGGFGILGAALLVQRGARLPVSGVGGVPPGERA